MFLLFVGTTPNPTPPPRPTPYHPTSSISQVYEIEDILFALVATLAITR